MPGSMTNNGVAQFGTHIIESLRPPAGTPAYAQEVQRLTNNILGLDELSGVTGAVDKTILGRTLGQMFNGGEEIATIAGNASKQVKNIWPTAKKGVQWAGAQMSAQPATKGLLGMAVLGGSGYGVFELSNQFAQTAMASSQYEAAAEDAKPAVENTSRLTPNAEQQKVLDEAEVTALNVSLYSSDTADQKKVALEAADPYIAMKASRGTKFAPFGKALFEKSSVSPNQSYAALDTEKAMYQSLGLSLGDSTVSTEYSRRTPEQQKQIRDTYGEIATRVLVEPARLREESAKALGPTGEGAYYDDKTENWNPGLMVGKNKPNLEYVKQPVKPAGYETFAISEKQKTEWIENNKNNKVMRYREAPSRVDENGNLLWVDRTPEARQLTGGSLNQQANVLQEKVSVVSKKLKAAASGETVSFNDKDLEKTAPIPYRGDNYGAVRAALSTDHLVPANSTGGTQIGSNDRLIQALDMLTTQLKTPVTAANATGSNTVAGSGTTVNVSVPVTITATSTSGMSSGVDTTVLGKYCQEYLTANLGPQIVTYVNTGAFG